MCICCHYYRADRQGLSLHTYYQAFNRYMDGLLPLMYMYYLLTGKPLLLPGAAADDDSPDTPSLVVATLELDCELLEDQY